MIELNEYTGTVEVKDVGRYAWQKRTPERKCLGMMEGKEFDKMLGMG